MKPSKSRCRWTHAKLSNKVCVRLLPTHRWPEHKRCHGVQWTNWRWNEERPMGLCLKRCPLNPFRTWNRKSSHGQHGSYGHDHSEGNTHPYRWIHLDTLIWIFRYIFIFTNIYIFLFQYLHICIYIYIYLHIYLHGFTHLFMYIYIYIIFMLQLDTLDTYIDTYIRICRYRWLVIIFGYSFKTWCLKIKSFQSKSFISS